MATGAGWSQLRQQARQLETQTETLLQQYSQYASMTDLPAKPSSEEQDLATQIQDIFQRREGTLTSLQRDVDSASPSQASGGTGPALKTSHLSRHRQVLTQHRGDVARLQSQIRESRNRSSLLASVRRDIQDYRASDPASQEAEYMLQERGRLDRSHNMADSLLSQAYATNDAFGAQREQLEQVRRRAMQVAGTIPGVNGLIARISNRRRRDGYILGSFIAACFLMVWFFS